MVETIEEQSSSTSVLTETSNDISLSDTEAKSFILSNISHPATLERVSEKQVVRTIIPGRIYRVNFLSRVQPEGCMCTHWQFTNQGRSGDSIMVKLVPAPNNNWKLIRLD
jgi:hypothetical protein